MMVGKIPRFRTRKRGKSTYYFYDHGGKPRRETALGKDYGLAIKRWAEIERASVLPAPAVVMFDHLADAYVREVIPRKANRTQRDNLIELAKLKEFFNDPPAPLDAIEPGHVQDYINWRKSAPVRATREKALLSHMWNWGRANRYTAKPNPCAGIKGAATGRDTYIEDDEYLAIWEAGSPLLRDAMDLAYLTGQRPADLLKATSEDARNGILHFKQGKTKAKVRVAIVGALETLLERIETRKAGMKQATTQRLLVSDYGRTVSVHTLSIHWANARKVAGLEGLQFRDLRAKAGTDTAEATGSLRMAQMILGHKRASTTEGYANRKGVLVMPTGQTRKTPENAEKEKAPKGLLSLEAEVGIEPAYADLQSDSEPLA